jgi:hypothetical protein
MGKQDFLSFCGGGLWDRFATDRYELDFAGVTPR